MSSPKVVIVTHSLDDHAPLIAAALEHIGCDYARIDTDTLIDNSAAEVSVSGARFVQAFNGRDGVVEGGAVRGVLFRFVKLSPYPPTGDETSDRLIASERTALLEGAILSLSPDIWLNHPHANQLARNKVLQLQSAQRIGFEVPQTLISSDPARIRSFYDDCRGGMIAKLVGGQLVGLSVDEQYVINTTRIEAGDLADDASLSAAPAIYQRLVEKAADIRATVVGDRVFGCEITEPAGVERAVDWRTHGYRALCHGAVNLPDDIATRCIAITRRFGLNMSGIDLIRRPDGTYVFLELNAAGQWAWVEEMTGQPIAAAIAGELARTSSERHPG